jgi:hypothetical protein
MAATDGAFDSATEAVDTTINVSRWRFGLHTVSVRTQDSVGNWGDVMTVTVEIRRRNANGPQSLFSDSFETANFSGWDTAVGNVTVNTAAALSEGLGMEASLAGGQPAYLQAQLPDIDKGFKLSFDFTPNNVDLAGEEQTIFTMLDKSGTAVFGILFEQDAAGPELMMWTSQADGTVAMSEGFHITNEVQTIHLKWDPVTDELSLFVDGALQTSLAGASAYQVDAIRLGLSGSVPEGASGSMYFDTVVVEPAWYDLLFPVLMNSGSN